MLPPKIITTLVPLRITSNLQRIAMKFQQDPKVFAQLCLTSIEQNPPDRLEIQVGDSPPKWSPY